MAAPSYLVDNLFILSSGSFDRIDATKRCLFLIAMLSIIDA